MNISEAASIHGLTPSTLRYYEKQGLLPPINRDASGNRDYSVEDINWIGFVKCMRDSGLSVEALARYTALYQMGDDTLVERKQLLIFEYEKLRQKQQQINDTVFKLKGKINHYEANIQNYQANVLQ
ncbi:MerR family transcriptional regulator [Enterococcus saccharolyticus]|nr:MerR family transcriptional regulator [Enterococcus saccharolyticus]